MLARDSRGGRLEPDQELAKLRVSGAPGVRQFRFRDFTAGPARQFATTTPLERQSGSLLIRRSHPAAGPHLTQSRISFVPDADAAEYAESGGAADVAESGGGAAAEYHTEVGGAVAEPFRPSWAATAKERRAAREARAAGSSAPPMAPPRLLAVSERAVASLPRAAQLAGVSESAPAPEDAGGGEDAPSGAREANWDDGAAGVAARGDGGGGGAAGAEQRASSWAATAKERRAARDERCRLAFQLGRQPSSCCRDPSTYQREPSSYNLASGVSPAYMAGIGNQAGREASGFQREASGLPSYNWREPSSYNRESSSCNLQSVAAAASGMSPPVHRAAERIQGMARRRSSKSVSE